MKIQNFNVKALLRYSSLVFRDGCSSLMKRASKVSKKSRAPRCFCQYLNIVYWWPWMYTFLEVCSNWQFDGRPPISVERRDYFIIPWKISYCMPGHQDTVYCGKIDGDKIFKPKHYGYGLTEKLKKSLIRNMKLRSPSKNNQGWETHTSCQGLERGWLQMWKVWEHWATIN